MSGTKISFGGTKKVQNFNMFFSHCIGKWDYNSRQLYFGTEDSSLVLSDHLSCHQDLAIMDYGCLILRFEADAQSCWWYFFLAPRWLPRLLETEICYKVRLLESFGEQTIMLGYIALGV